jgi:RNA-directed DNA polymerase
MESEVINLSLDNLYKSWWLFRRGKIASREIIEFEYYLEGSLRRLQEALEYNKYQPGKYRQFEVVDNKRRLIKVAPVRDRVVHRLLYEYLREIFDKTFIYDAWSCRENKGLIKAIKRSQEFLRRNPSNYFWRTDIRKFFDNVNKEELLKIIQRKVKDIKAIEIIKAIIFSQETETAYGIPIGNLTSQIFANIYLNELDRFIKHDLKIKYYLRYGDDFFILADNYDKLKKTRIKVKDFLSDKLWLEINCHHDIIIKVSRGLKFLGAIIYPDILLLNRRNRKRLIERINLSNISSYSGLIRQYEPKKVTELNYLILEILNKI